MAKFIYLLFIQLFSFSFCAAQLSVQTDHLDMRYVLGDTVQLKITGNSSATHYRIWEDKFTPIALEDTLQLTDNQGIVNWQPTRAGVWQFEAIQDAQSAKTAIVVSPYTLTALEKEPTDFDAFWDVAKAELNNIPMDAQLTFYEEDEYSTSYRINLMNINQRRVYGYISIPKTEGPFPAMLILPPYGTGENLVTAKPNISRDLGAIVMAISIHNAEPDVLDPHAYEPRDFIDPTNNYYRQAITGALQAINYLHTRSDFNEDLAVSGVSQGAGLAVMTAGLEERVKLLTYSGVTHAQHQGFDYQQVSGFPYYLHQTRFTTHEDKIKARSAVSYYESIYFARRFKGTALAMIGYLDQVTHPATQFAVFNNLSGEKTLIHGTKIEHAHPNAFWQMRYAAFFQIFPHARTTAWRYANIKTAYAIQLATDSVATVGEPFAVNSSVLLNGETVNNVIAEWSYKKANGTFQISSNTTLNTEFAFPESGDYVIRLRIEDQRDLLEEHIFHTVEKTMKLTVEAAPIPSELKVICPIDSTILLPSNVDSVLLNWSLPQVESVCDLAGVTIFQTAGVLNNSRVGVGTYDISYLIYNKCGDSLTCSFQFLMEQEEETVTETEEYCENKGIIPWQEWIEEVELNDLSLFSRKESYGNFLDYSATLCVDSSYQMSVRIGYISMDTTEHIHAYIDFNQDYIFQENERVFQAELTQSSDRSGMKILQQTISTPADAKLGTTRMRVLLSKAIVPDPCNTIQYGEVEDYTIVLTEKTSGQITVATSDLNQQTWQIYPNPVTDVIYVKGNLSEDHSVRAVLYDALGRQVQTTNVSFSANKNSFVLPVEQLQNGFYYLKIMANDELLKQQAILVQH